MRKEDVKLATCKLYKLICRKPLKIPHTKKISVRTYTWIQQSSRIQSQHTKSSCNSCTLTMNNLKRKITKQFYLEQHQIYLEINLTKEVKDLYNENCKTLMKELKMTNISHVHKLEEPKRKSNILF